MLFKLSIKNIKKSIKDYGIYFFTLVFAVSMFYMFNSIDAQSSMLVLNNSKYEIITVLIELINYASIFVSFILGFLIVYSNNFLVRRRKKEIGLYQILGMSKRKVSFILTFETLLIGIVSLVVGLLCGVFLSQFLSLFVAKLFEVNMTGFKFVFSLIAFKKTILYFGIIFLFVMLFNVVIISKNKLIDLITAEKKNELVKIRNKYVTIVAFILSIAFLGYAYYLLLVENALVMMDYKIGLMIASGSLGTFLLFFSLSGFLLKIIEKNKNVYYKGLNIFTMKQVNSKINTAVVSTTVICLMLLLTIGMLSGSMSLAKVFNNDFADNNIFDYTILVTDTDRYVNTSLVVQDKKDNIKNFKSELANGDISLYTKDYVLINKYYDKNLTVTDLMNKEDMDALIKEYGAGISLDGSVTIINETEYSKLFNLMDKKVIDIDSDQYLLFGNIEFINDAYKGHYEDKKPLVINGRSLTPASDKIIVQGYENYNSSGNDGVIVVSDEVASGLDLLNLTIVGNFVSTGDKEKIGDEFYKYILDFEVPFDYRTRIAMEASSLGLKTMVIFLGLYLGITFAISSATVLAIRQLSESSDNKKRYKILNQIGADVKMINKSLFTNIAITFTFPLVIALVHAYFGLKKINSLLIIMGSIDLTANILLTTLFMVIVYGGYFLITYLSSKRIISND